MEGVNQNANKVWLTQEQINAYEQQVGGLGEAQIAKPGKDLAGILLGELIKINTAGESLVNDNASLQEKIQTATEILKNKDTEILNLNQQITSLKDENAEAKKLKEAVKDLTDQKAEVEKQLVEAKKLEGQVQELTTQKAEVERQLESKTAEHNKTLDTFGPTVKENETLKAQVEKLNTANQDLKLQIEAQNQAAVKAQDEYQKQLQSLKDEMANNQEGLEETITRLKNTVQIQNERVRQLKGSEKNLLETNETLQENTLKVKELTAQLKNSNNYGATVSNKNLTLQGKIADLQVEQNERIQQLEKANAEQVNKILEAHKTDNLVLEVERLKQEKSKLGTARRVLSWSFSTFAWAVKGLVWETPKYIFKSFVNAGGFFKSGGK